MDSCGFWAFTVTPKPEVFWRTLWQRFPKDIWRHLNAFRRAPCSHSTAVVFYHPSPFCFNSYCRHQLQYSLYSPSSVSQGFSVQVALGIRAFNFSHQEGMNSAEFREYAKQLPCPVHPNGVWWPSFQEFHLTKERSWWRRLAKVKSIACILHDDTGEKKCLLMALRCYSLPKWAELFFLLFSNKINF